MWPLHVTHNIAQACGSIWLRAHGKGATRHWNTWIEVNISNIMSVNPIFFLQMLEHAIVKLLHSLFNVFYHLLLGYWEPTWIVILLITYLLETMGMQSQKPMNNQYFYWWWISTMFWKNNLGSKMFFILNATFFNSKSWRFFYFSKLWTSNYIWHFNTKKTLCETYHKKIWCLQNMAPNYKQVGR